MNRTNARIAQFAAVVALTGALGCLNANPVNYYSGYSQPTLLAAAAPSDAFGTQNVSFVQTPAPVQNIYQSVTVPSSSTATQPAPASASSPATYTSSYFQSTSATTSSTPTTSTSTNSTVAPVSAFSTASAVSTQAASQTQTLAYASYMQATSAGPQTSGPSAVTAAYVSAFGTPAISPVPNVAVPSNPLGVSYFQVASALSPLNIASSASPSRPTQVGPFGPRMVDIYNPEPGTIALIGGGLGLLLILRRRILAR